MADTMSNVSGIQTKNSLGSEAKGSTLLHLNTVLEEEQDTNNEYNVAKRPMHRRVRTGSVLGQKTDSKLL